MKLRNKVALITGASQGIGKGIAEVFAEEGADLVINHVGSCDKACVVAEWVRSKGRRALVLEADVRERSQVEAMFERAEKELGRVDVLVNNAGKVLPGRTHYAPAKLAIEALTRNVSAEMGALGIRVNCIHPGLIETPMVDWVLKHPDPSILAGVVAQISLGRAGQPQEIGTVAAFFASDEAKYVTGQSLYVDGGWVGK